VTVIILCVIARDEIFNNMFSSQNLALERGKKLTSANAQNQPSFPDIGLGVPDVDLGRGQGLVA
jgi:hypothetical protein